MTDELTIDGRTFRYEFGMYFIEGPAMGHKEEVMEGKIEIEYGPNATVIWFEDATPTELASFIEKHKLKIKLDNLYHSELPLYPEDMDIIIAFYQAMRPYMLEE